MFKHAYRLFSWLAKVNILFILLAVISCKSDCLVAKGKEFLFFPEKQFNSKKSKKPHTTNSNNNKLHIFVCQLQSQLKVVIWKSRSFHPVALVSGDLTFLWVAVKYDPVIWSSTCYKAGTDRSLCWSEIEFPCPLAQPSLTLCAPGCLWALWYRVLARETQMCFTAWSMTKWA